MPDDRTGAQRASLPAALPLSAGRSSTSSPARPAAIRHPRGSRSIPGPFPALLLGGLLLLVLSAPAFAHEATDISGLRPTVGAGLRPGDLVGDHGISIVVPERGESVWGELKSIDGTYQVLQVETTRDGTVRLLQYGDEAAAASGGVVLNGLALTDPATAAISADQMTVTPDASRSSRPECHDRYRNLYSWRTKNLRWSYHVKGTPRYLLGTDGYADVVDSLKRANKNIVTAHNLCGFGDRVSARFRYMGTSWRRPGVSSRGSCRKGDGHSVIGFGSLPFYTVAMTCVHHIRGGVATEGDVLINRDDVRWKVTGPPCSKRDTYLESAMTHEFGHVYGLAHASTSSHPWLTMQPMIWPCRLGQATLGLGDIRGLERKY